MRNHRSAEKKSKRRLKKGTCFTIFGLLLLLAALLLTAYNLWAERRAGQEAADAFAALEQEMEAKGTDDAAASGELPDYLLCPDMEMPVLDVNGRSYIGILEIPSLNLRLPVISQWSKALLDAAPCRYSGSAYSGDLIIAGHNYRTHFGRLKNLKAGDEILFTDVENHTFRYQVAEIQVLDQTATEEMQQGDWDLTLFTCTYARVTRLTVRCTQE